MRSLLLIAALLATAGCRCSEERGEKPAVTAPTAGSASPEPGRWPLEGVCPLGRQSADCTPLLPADAIAIESAVRAYLTSEAAIAAHGQADRDAAASALGPADLEPSEGAEQPRLGDYYVYQGDAGGDGPGARGVRLQNTASAADERRWGYRFDLQRDGDRWRVEGFSRWRAWGGTVRP